MTTKLIDVILQVQRVVRETKEALEHLVARELWEQQEALGKQVPREKLEAQVMFQLPEVVPHILCNCIRTYLQKNLTFSLIA